MSEQPVGVDAAKRVVAALDFDRLTADVIELVKIPSVSGTPGEVRVQEWYSKALAEAGLTVDQWDLDLAGLAAHPDFPGVEVHRERAIGCVGTTGEGPAGLILQGHTDVVPVGNPADWSDDPFGAGESRGYIWGRGSTDMKAGVAVNLAVARAVMASGIELAKPLAVHAVVGEEDGGLGAFGTLMRGHLGEACVITEPTGGGVVIANAGALTFRIEVSGRPAHGALRKSGQSSVESFWVIHQALLEFEALRNLEREPLFAHNPLPYALSIGTVNAGEWSSTVPELLVAQGRLGVKLGEPVDEARAAFEAVVERACAGDAWLRNHAPRVLWTGGQFASGQLPHGHELLDQMQTSLTSAGLATLAPMGLEGGSDLRLYNAAGIPTLHYGPGHLDQAHVINEHVPIRMVHECARALATLAARRCAA